MEGCRYNVASSLLCPVRRASSGSRPYWPTSHPRTALADLVCSEFGFCLPPCAPQCASCLQGLGVLDSRDLIELPPPLTPGGDGRPLSNDN